MQITIRPERPDTPDARALVEELEAELSALYPPEQRFGLAVEQLLAQGVDFFVLRVDGAAAGCGGLLGVGAEYGEVKRVYVRPALRGRGLSRHILDRLAAHALARGLPLLRLETGTLQREALILYERYGFYRIGPFGEYPDIPSSIFYEKRLAAPPIG